jgi:vacuolar-type H+-ATPase subunit E/Vma4
LSDKPELLQTILAEAEDEAGRIVTEARATAEARRKTCETQCRQIEEDAEKNAVERENAIKRLVSSRIEVESRRERLKAREEAGRAAIEAARERLGALVGKPEYKTILRGWIAEAAVGLGEPEAEVNASAAERVLLDDGLLREVSALVRETTGREVTLKTSAEQPLIGQGIVLTATGGHVAFNNQVSTRIMRAQSDIRRLIHDRLFGDEQP